MQLEQKSIGSVVLRPNFEFFSMTFGLCKECGTSPMFAVRGSNEEVCEP